MRIIQREASEISPYVTDQLVKQLQKKKNSVLGLATGSTPLAIYKYWIEQYKLGKLDFSQVITFNLDEYVNLPASNPQSYHDYMNLNLFQHININKDNTHIPNGMAVSLEEECNRYDQLIQHYGGIDLQILGIGLNGHIGFNEPAVEQYYKTNVAQLNESTREANSRFFENIEQVPKQAITMGMGSIFNAKKIILIAKGIEKSTIIQRAFLGNITTQVPASLLQLHPDVEIVVDTQCGKLVPEHAKHS